MQEDEFDLTLFLPYLLNQAAETSSLEFQKVYKGRYGMLRTEWRVLFHLGLYGSMTASDIGQRAKMHKTKISRAVAKLAERRYLTRERDEADRRLEYLQLTSTGTQAYRNLREVALEYNSGLLAQFSEKEAVVLRRLLRKLAQVEEG